MNNTPKGVIAYKNLDMNQETNILTAEQAFYLLLIFSDVDDENGFTPMEANKLVYISHGWSLGLLERPLIYNEFREIEAWEHGPVIVNLYHELKRFKKEKINLPKYKKYKNKKHGTDYVKDKITSSLLKIIQEEDNKTGPLLRWVYDKYGDWEAWELRGATHKEGTPWDTCVRNMGLNSHISDDVIKEHYKSRINQDA